MKTRTLTLILAVLTCCPCFAQLRIEDCYDKAQANYPLIRQYDLISKTQEYNLSNANKGYIPQITVSGKATYQSEVTEIPIPGIESPDKDQYVASIELTQTIWDGGAIRARKEGIRTSAEVDKKTVEVSIYSINERINQIFFGILLMDAQIEQNRILRSDLQQNNERITSYIEFGIANQADLDAVKVEQLKAVQNLTRLTHSRNAYLAMLSTLIGENLSSDVQLIKPDNDIAINTEIRRPELELYDAQVRNLEAKNSEIKSGLMPKFDLFVSGNYGRPGYNMLDNDFRGFYIGGVRLSWRLGNYYTNKNNRRLVQAGIGSVNTQRETFLFNTGLDVTKRLRDIDNYRDQMRYDDDIIALRTSVRQASESKMANGTYSAIDLMRDINAEDMARQDKILHEIELLLAIYNLKFTTNN